ncbi:CAP-associated domain-containing protein [Enterococcus sp. CWB-B31]|uniref:CAP-associated domain-containing protein n=1 Tax=Enterococcus sp. CWB-B31 TaxID=2885159 RepID=UPI001E49208E|nr:CAP-associated domain-containing protein [Enterococcus sp. CWB-B31]MCB5955218.1 hypothetical protein [Enterococcus sp. CWB-B31]
MKRVLAFLAVLSTVLIIGYLEPVFFPPEKVEIDISNNGGQVVSHTALPHEELEASGYALYIGKKISTFTQEFGEPLTRYSTGLGYDLLIFGEEDSEYMEVSVNNDIIQSVKVFNTTDRTAPFNFEMTLSDISELTTIFSNFSIDYEAEEYSIELTEEDMNYRPLIAFDNQSFAVLFFTHGKESISGITYVSKEYLLTVMPYQLTTGQALPITIEETEAEIAAEKQKTIIRMINLLRINDGLEPYAINSETMKNAVELYRFYEENASEFLSVERLESLSQVKNESLGEIASAFIFSNTEFEKMADKSNLPLRKPDGIYMTPVYDPSFAALFWFSDGAYYARFSQENAQNIGVAFSKEDVLVLLENTQNNTEETEDSR